MENLNKAYEFDFGFPSNRFGRDPHYLPEGKPNNGLLTTVSFCNNFVPNYIADYDSRRLGT